MDLLHKWFALAAVYRYIPKWCSGKESAFQCRRCKRVGFNPWVGKIPWRRKWQPTPVFLPGKFHEQRSLAGRLPSTGSQKSDSLAKFIDFVDLIKELPLCFINFLYFLFSILLISALTFFL